jgi:mannosyltransferase
MPRSPRVTARETIAIGLLAALISFAWSWHPAYWHDEAATLSAADRSPGQLWDMLNNMSAVNGLYLALMHAWVDAFGTTEVATRLFSAIGLFVTCGGVVLLGQELGGRILGVAAGLVAAVLPGLSWAGAEARVYAWNSAGAVVATLLLVRAWESRRARDWVWYTAATTVTGYLFLFSLLLLPVHLVTLVILRRVSRAWWVAAGATVAAMTPLFVVAAEQRGRVEYEHMGLVELAGKAGVRQYFLSTRADDGFGIALVCAVLLLLVGVGLAVAGLRRLGDDRSAVVLWVAVPWTALPTLLLVGYSVLFSPVYQERYLTFSAPGLALLLAFGLLQLPRPGPVFVTACVLILVLPVPILVQQKGEASRSGQDYRRLAQFVRTQASAVVFTHNDARSIQFAYPDDFADVAVLDVRRTPQASDSLWGQVWPARHLERRDVTGRRVALVTFTGESVDQDPYVLWLTRNGCHVATSTAGTRLTIRIFAC